MSKLESMQGAARMAVLAAALALYAPGALAHHNSQAEFGAFGSDTIAVEGTIVDVHWSNPHISIVTFDESSAFSDINRKNSVRLMSNNLDSSIEMAVAG